MPKSVSSIFLSALCVFGFKHLSADEFEWKSEGGIEVLRFETELMSGLVVAQDHRDLGKGFGLHGVRELTYKEHDLNAPEPPVGAKRRHQGLLNLYRVYSSTETFGSLRDDQGQLKELENGAQLFWPASKERPVAITGTWKITGPAQIDVQVEATPTKSIENFEILPAVYLPVHMTKAVYLEGQGGPVFSEVRPNPAIENDLNYRFYPLGEEARSAQENSGRIHSSWKWKSVVMKERAGLPIVVAEDETLQVLLMGNPDSVSAVCATPLPWEGNPEDWNSVQQHSALYFSLFGRDVEPGKTYRARMRLQVIDRPEDTMKRHQQLLETFLEEAPK